MDEKFWREVATRTVAGILTLIFLGFPGVLYSMSAGILQPEQGMPILIGATVMLGLILLYTIAQLLARFVTRRMIVQAIRDANELALGGIDRYGSIRYARQLMNADLDERAVLMKDFSQALQRQLLCDLKQFAIMSVVAGIVAGGAALVAALYPLLANL